MTAWVDLPTLRSMWSDAPMNDAIATNLLGAAQEQCEAYAPALPEGAPVPDRYIRAVILQTQENWNAGERDGDVLGFDGDYAIRVRPLTTSVKALLRPSRGRPRFWPKEES